MVANADRLSIRWPSHMPLLGHSDQHFIDILPIINDGEDVKPFRSHSSKQLALTQRLPCCKQVYVLYLYTVNTEQDFCGGDVVPAY